MLFTEALHRAGVTCMPHLGKSWFPCQLFRTCLSRKQRERWVAVLDAFDPARIFDGGKVKLRDMFDLTTQGARFGISKAGLSGTVTAPPPPMPFGRSLLALEDAIDVLVQSYYCLACGSQLSLSTLQGMEARLRSLRSATAPHVGERASLASDTAPFHINLLEHAIEVLFRAYLSLCVQLKAGGTMPPSSRQVLESLDAIPPMLATFLPTLRFEITMHVGAQPTPAASGTQ